MPVKWTLDMECEMLLIAVSNLKPAASTWQAVADRLGHGLNANAVSQKFHKLKREAENRADGNSTSATPSITTSKAAKTPKSTGSPKRKINSGTEETPGKRIKAAQAEAGEEEEDGGSSNMEENRVTEESERREENIIDSETA